MKKSLILSLLLAVLGVCALPGALLLADSGKERIQIREEVLSGNPAEAAGVVLRIPAHWGRRLLWDTEYVIGAGAEAESSFTFSAGQVFWKGSEERAQAFLRFQDEYNASFSEGYTALREEYGGFYEIIDSVARQTENGETCTETIWLEDYGFHYPLDLVTNFSVQVDGNYMQASGYLGDFFHIGTGEDIAEVTVKKNLQGQIEEAAFRQLDSDGDVEIVSAAADGGQGIYLAFGLRDRTTGEAVDRGQNRGIFYFPYETEDKGVRRVDLTQVKKLQDISDDINPLEMLTDKERKTLLLTVEDQEGFSLLVYRLEEETPILSDRIPVKAGHGSFCRMWAEDGGILLTFDDNSFSFVAEETGQYREWCRGVFPGSAEADADSGNPFPKEQECLFDGKRLTLAAYEDWNSLNVLLAVYDGTSLTYSGRYVHSGNEDRDAESDPACRLLPQGYREGRPQDYWDVWEWGNWRYYTDENPEPLEIFRRAGQQP